VGYSYSNTGRGEYRRSANTTGDNWIVNVFLAMSSPRMLRKEIVEAIHAKAIRKWLLPVGSTAHATPSLEDLLGQYKKIPSQMVHCRCTVNSDRITDNVHCA
jgi:tetrahydromethanopterin S-methyltransferase subunit H